MSFLKTWRQAWRIAEMRLLFLALVISVTAVTSVNFFTDRTERLMTMQATKLLGADVIVRSSRPLDKAYLSQAETLGLSQAEMISFRSMVSVGESLKLAQVKAVSPNYPLRGNIETNTTLQRVGKKDSISELKPGQVWAAPSLFTSLNIQPSSEVRIGRSLFELSKALIKTPDQGSNVFQFAPPVLMPLADLPQTGLLTPGSRASFSFLFAGDESQVIAMRDWLKGQLKTGERLETLNDGAPAVNTALQRAQRFLNTAALLSVILAGAAIALTSYSFSLHETHTVAVLKTMGASRRKILYRYLGQLFITSSAAALLGIFIGFLIQGAVAYFLRDMLQQDLPSTSIFPAITGLLTAWIMVLSFSTPQLLQLVNTAPVQIFQRQSAGRNSLWKFLLGTILVGIFALMWMQTRDLKLSLFIFIGVLAAVIVFWLVATLLLWLLKRISKNSQYTLRSLSNAGQRLQLLIVVFGIGLFSLLLLTALQTDLLDRWQNSIPEKAPNHFLINIQPTEVTELKNYLSSNDINPELYPLIRGRLVEIKGKPVTPDDYESPRSKRLLQREFNLSSVKELPEANIMLEGEWFKEEGETGFSVEESVMERFALKLGDTLTFDIAGQKATQTITSVRRVNWDNLTPNFFVLAAPGSMSKLPQTLITSLYVPPEDTKLIPQLVKQHPSVSAIDITAIMMQIKDLISKAALAIQAIFGFTLISGIIVLFAALQSQRAERRRELAILKTIGASRKQLKKTILTEFALVGGIAGLLAGTFAMLASNIAAYSLFDLQPTFNFFLIFIGVGSGAVLVGIAGYINLRPLLQVAPAMLFQEHEA